MMPRVTCKPAVSIGVGRFEVLAWVTDAGVCRLELPPGLPGLAEKEAGHLRVTIRREPGKAGRRHVAEMVEFLGAVMAGKEPGMVPRPDLSGVSEFTALVLGETGRIPWGEVRSYGWIADRLGRSGAARAVGGALGRNPVPLLVPCHRVVSSDGTIGGFGLGAGFKEWLLSLERGKCRPNGGPEA